MFSIAGGLAQMVSELPVGDYQFSMWTSPIVEGFINEVTVSGSWDRNASTNEVAWNGDDPFVTNEEEDAKTVTYLGVGYGTGSVQERRVASLPLDSAIELGPGDSIEFTSIKIEFNTEHGST